MTQNLPGFRKLLTPKNRGQGRALDGNGSMKTWQVSRQGGQGGFRRLAALQENAALGADLFTKAAGAQDGVKML
jgi:hypothetical protein